MDIRLNARLSAYSKTNAGKPMPCGEETITKADIDSLFGGESIDSFIPVTSNNSCDVISFKDIDSLFNKE